MVNMEKDPLLLEVIDQLSVLRKRVDEKIDKEQQQLEASKKNNELESKMAEEMKLNRELTAQASEASHRQRELERVCAALRTRLTLADSDRARLQHAKETYELAKQLTGVRLDFSAAPHAIKGYVKSESRRVLEPFQVGAPAALWDTLAAVHLHRDDCSG